jgi:chloramphenicol 3-O phosphotransferase
MGVHVILLNGVGSAGKSSIAKALHILGPRVYLHVQMDAFLDMLPERMLDSPEGFTFEPTQEDGGAAVRVSSGPEGARLLRGMRQAVAGLAAAGNHLIVDEVATAADIAEYRALLADHQVEVVAIEAPLEVLEQRERDRGDRMIGLARWQYSRIHAGIEYDLVVDSGTLTVSECAEAIHSFVDGQRTRD